jgi:transposase
MPIPTLPCETLSPVAKPKSDEALRREKLMLDALAARDRAAATLERRREELAAAIVDLFRTGEYKAAEIGRKVDYTPEHVRRILRAAGIQGDPTRLTPAQRAAQAAPETETGR